MKKSRISLFLLILLSSLSILISSITPVNAQAGIPSEDGWKPVEYKFTEFQKEGSSSPKNLTWNFSYSDRLLYSSSETGKPDPSLAKASIALAAEAYIGASAMKKTLEAMGFSVITSENYDRQSTYLDCDFVAYTIASKIINIDGEEFIAYCVPIRGTDGREWYSDFELGESGNHRGFYT